jgi:P-type conjugative transfer protein TrbJ
MVKNTVAPVAWVWNEATQTYQTFRSYADMLQYYAKGGGVEGYLSTFQSVAYYAGSPCFTAQGCSWAEIQAIHDRERAASEAEKRANDAQIRGVSLGQDQLQQDAADLMAVQKAAQSSQGRNEMLGASNQLAAANANNLLAVRALLLQQQAAENARAATLANREAIQHVADQAALAGQFVRSPVLNYAHY